MRISDWSSDVCYSDLADGEGRTEAAIGARDADALIILDAGAFAFDDADADAKGVAGAEFGDRLGRLELLAGLGLEGLDEVHFTCLHSRAARQRATERVRSPASPSGPSPFPVCPCPPHALP